MGIFTKCGVVLLCSYGIVLDSSAYLVDGGETNNISESINIAPEEVIVGLNETGNLLAIESEVVFGAGNIFVGTSGSSDNSLLFGINSGLVSDGSISIGYDGSDNEMRLVRAGVIASGSGAIGVSEDSSNNHVLIDGTGAGWGVDGTAGDGNLFVGVNGSDNALYVQNKGVVSAVNLVAGYSISASNNSVIVSDGGLIVYERLVAGSGGDQNSVIITNGAVVTATDVYVGEVGYASDNLLKVSGADSLLELYGVLNVGTSSNSGNRAVVESGGVIYAEELNIQGSNRFDLDDGGRLVVRTNFNAAASGFNWNDGGELEVYGSLTGVNDGLDGGKILTVAGDWLPASSNVVVGGNSSGNSLNIVRGGQVGVESLAVGVSSNSVNNSVLITNSLSKLWVNDMLAIGASGNSNNSVVVESGGSLVVMNGVAIEGNDNTLALRDGGSLSVMNDFDASIDGFDFGVNSSLRVNGVLTGMTNVVDGGRALHVSGTRGQWDLGAEDLQVSGASLSISNGALLVSSGAIISSNGQIVVQGAGSAWTNSGVLVMGDASTNASIQVVRNGSVFSDGEVVVGQAGGSAFLNVSGAGSSWATAGEVHVLEGSQLMVEDGAAFGSVGSDVQGAAVIRGAGSTWSDSQGLEVMGAGAHLWVLDGGAVTVAGQLSLVNGGQINVSSGMVSAVSYHQDGDSVVTFSNAVEGVVDSGPAVINVDTSAKLDEGATFAYVGSVSDVGVGVTNTRMIVSSGELVVGGVTNASGSELDVLNGNIGNNLLDSIFVSQGSDLFMYLYRRGLGDSAGFSPDSMMYEVSEEIDLLATGGDQVAINQLNLIGQFDGAVQKAQLSQLYERNAPTYMHMEGLAEGMRQVRVRGIMPDAYWPIGPQGPHYYGSQVQGWFKGYGSWGSHNGGGSYSAYDQSVYGMAIGVDKSFGELLAGIAGGYSISNIDQDDGDSSEASLGYGVLYGSWGNTDWFADAGFGLGMGSVENRSGTVFDSASDFDASQVLFYLSGGKEMIFRNDTIFLTPTFGVQAGGWFQDGYKDRTTDAVARRVESYDRFSFKSDVGLKADFHKTLGRFILVPGAHANWLHEFNADEDSVGYSLDGGTGRYSFGMLAPVEDLFEFGAALSLWTEAESGSVYEWSLGLDSRFGGDYSATAFNARLVVEF